jgi:Ca2+-dependent lipid-binding protein
MNENILLDDSGISCNIEVTVKCCKFRYRNSLKEGNLKMIVNSISDLKGSSKTGLRDSYFKIYINETQIYRSKIKKKTLNPVFNEEASVQVDKRYDTLKITVQDWSSFDASPIIGILEVPFHFLEEGSSVYKMDLLDQKTRILTGAKIEIAFEFTRDDIPSLKKKKNILNAFLPF